MPADHQKPQPFDLLPATCSGKRSDGGSGGDRPRTRNVQHNGVARTSLESAETWCYILTNRHVAGPGPFCGLCIFDQEAVSCRPLCIDPIHDFAFLKYDPEGVRNTAIDGLVLSPDGATVGQPVLVVGNDAGEATSIIAATISRTDRNAPEYDGPYSDLNISYYMANMNLSGGISGSPAVGEDSLEAPFCKPCTVFARVGMFV
ncbi:Peptidase cysteine/serine, trypsin-like protein [Cordyceps fumosorosea ARSEF 2679]|uniref:Pro-apoptotic serine protease NMA111 n=1 Tax=Cordyceps fumosorosea (strain ARSEF 2679) TaxID=1081104 RepID=A0A167GBU4_CORFA|nr:Peptidase cysteine/serine, trypsin-like protein [Cordyceps fumosorosea ARSEF 2679]OAA46424.1 Peptidase cysteine/serine, trypsin-like protein [Cordyceps fumosorosea ARSEF 2679]